VSARSRLPRQIRVGALARHEPGALLRCAVLAATGDEWAGVDLESGALVRSLARVPLPDVLATHRPLEVVEVRLGLPDKAPDPARPEAIALAEASGPVASLTGRQARRLLRKLAAPERDAAPLLGRWGPSVAFEDLDGSAPSLALIAVGADDLAFSRDPRGPRCSIAWSGVRQDLPLADPTARRAVLDSPTPTVSGASAEAALGFTPGFALVALGAIQAGYAAKVVLTVLPW